MFQIETHLVFLNYMFSLLINVTFMWIGRKDIMLHLYINVTFLYGGRKDIILSIYADCTNGAKLDVQC